MLSGVKSPFPGDIHEGVSASAAHSDNAGFGKGGSQPMAEQGHLIGERHLVDRQIIGVDVHVPKAGHQIPAFEIDHPCVADVARLTARQDCTDAAVLDQHGSIRLYLGLDTVDQACVGKDCLHNGHSGCNPRRRYRKSFFRWHFTSAPWRERRGRQPRRARRIHRPCAGSSCWQTTARNRQTGSADILPDYRPRGSSAGIRR